MKYIYIDDYDYIKTNIFLFKKKEIFITSSIAIHNFISQNSQNKSFLLGEQKSFEKNFKRLKKNFTDFHKTLKTLDQNVSIKKMKENKDLKIFFNSHRYLTSLEYASIKNIINNIEILSQKKKFNKIKLIGNLRFNFFSKSFSR